MNFKHAYGALIKEENLAALKARLSEGGYYTPAICDAISIRMEGDLPYLYCPITLHEGWKQTPGMLDSTFIDLGSLLPEWKGDFYFSVLFMAAEEDYVFHKFLPFKATLAHELLHLKQMIGIITADPQYISRARKYCLDATKVYDLRFGLRYEIEKIFKMEVEAHVQDWDLGVRHLISVNSNEEAKAVEYSDKNMYLQHNIAVYICMIMMHFAQKFPSKNGEIKSVMNTLMNEYGKPLFGKTPLIGFYTAFMEATKRIDNPKLVQAAGFVGEESNEFEKLKKILKRD